MASVPDLSGETPFASAADLNPRDADALPIIERHLIAACVQGDDGAQDAATIVSPGDFAIIEHEIVFGAIVALVNAGRDVWAVDVFQELHRSGDINRLGGVKKFHAWLSETTELEPTGMHARYHAVTVREASLFRQLRGVAAEIMKMAVRPTGPAAEVLGDAERLLFDLSDVSAVKGDTVRVAADFLKDAVTRIDDRIASGGKLAGLSTGYPDLDDPLGGMREGQLIVVGARPGCAKTALGVNIAVKVAQGGVPVLLFSLEMPEDEVSGRLLAIESGVSMHTITRASRIAPEDAAAIALAAGPSGMGGCAIHVDQTPDQPAARMAAVTRREIRRHGVQLVIVDYLQLIRAENPKENRNQQVGLACRRVRNMARECGVPILLLCQLNRDVESRSDRRPRLADLRESGEIEQHANVVILLHTDNPDPALPVWNTELIIAKNRNGPVGSVTLNFRRPVMRFENYTPDFGEE